MKITWSRMTLKMARPFRTSKAVRTDKETIWVIVHDDGVRGSGEVVPMDTYRQTLDSAELTLSKIAARAFWNAEELGSAIEGLTGEFGDQLATVAGLDAAFLDWQGKKRGQPTWRALGVTNTSLPLTSFSLGLESDLDLLAGQVRDAASFPILKIKLGTEQDERILEVIRREAPTAIIRVDANMAWSVDEALSKLPMLAKYDVEFVEQPLAADDLEGLRKLKQAGVLPIIADESCVLPDDIDRLAGHVDGINIKLSKCGGIRQGLEMIRRAREAGLRIMLGCMVESSLGIAAALQLGPLVDWLDLDGHLLLAEDPFSGIGGSGGVLRLASEPGLGVFPRQFRNPAATLSS